MIDIKLKYNPETGDIYHPVTNAYIIGWVGLEDCEIKQEDTSTAPTPTTNNTLEVALLATQGISADQMLSLKEVGLL